MYNSSEAPHGARHQGQVRAAALSNSVDTNGGENHAMLPQGESAGAQLRRL
jgi:hypothetical protein